MTASNGNPPKQNDRHCDDSKVTVSASEYMVNLKKNVKREFVLDFFQI